MAHAMFLHIECLSLSRFPNSSGDVNGQSLRFLLRVLVIALEPGRVRIQKKKDHALKQYVVLDSEERECQTRSYMYRDELHVS